MADPLFLVCTWSNSTNFTQPECKKRLRLHYYAQSHSNDKQVDRAQCSQEEAGSLADSQVPQFKRSDLLGQFFVRCGWRLPIKLPPIDQTLGIVSRVRKHRSTEFIPLIRATSLADNKDVHVDHIRINGADGDLLLDQLAS